MSGLTWALRLAATYLWVVVALLLIVIGLLIIGVTILDWWEDRKFVRIERMDQ